MSNKSCELKLIIAIFENPDPLPLQKLTPLFPIKATPLKKLLSPLLFRKLLRWDYPLYDLTYYRGLKKLKCVFTS